MVQEKKKSKMVVVLIILLVFKAILMFLNFAYAQWGTYAHNRADNLWSNIWVGCYVMLWSIISGILSVIFGLIGIITAKGNKTKLILSIVLLVTILPGIFFLIVGIGTHF